MDIKRGAKFPMSKAKELKLANRRRKVLEYREAGKSRAEIARMMGVSITTIARDISWANNRANVVRLEETVKEHGVEVMDKIPTVPEEYQEYIRGAVLDLVESKKTYRQVSRELGVSLGSIHGWVNDYLAEIGDFAGRTVDQWRMEQILLLDLQITKVTKDSFQEAVPKYDDEGIQDGWEITPTRAAGVRNQSTKILVDLLYRKAKLLGLDQQKKEIEITRNAVVRIRGINPMDFPQLEDVSIIEGEYVNAGS